MKRGRTQRQHHNKYKDCGGVTGDVNGRVELVGRAMEEDGRCLCFQQSVGGNVPLTA